MSEAHTGFKHLPSAPAFLFHPALSTASELSTPSMVPHNPFAHGAAGAPFPAVPCAHDQCTQMWGRGPQKAEPRLCPGPRPTLCFCHRPGLSERDHHRNHQDQQPGRTVLLSEYPRGPQALQGQIPYNSRERGSPEGRRRLWGRAAWRAFCNYFPLKSPDV